MKVLFLEIDTERDWAVASIGPAYLAAWLRQRGGEAQGLRVPLDMGAAELERAVRSAAPDLVGVSLTTRQWRRGRDLALHLRRTVDAPLVAGGLHPTFSPEAVLDCGAFDFACLGEGEEALWELLCALDGRPRPVDPLALEPIANLWPRGGLRPPLRPPLAALDDLPFPARDLLDEKHGVVHVSTQRGCPFPCTYCAARQYADLYGPGAGYGRRRSHASVLSELESIRRTGELNYVIFLDDTFTIYPTWVREFCARFAQELRVPFSIHARADTVDSPMLRALADAGCRHIVYGVESGSPRVRREIMERPISNQCMIEAFRLTREVDILATANYMLGLPGETPADLEQTLALHEQLRPDDFGYFVFHPYPGTRLFHVCQERGFLPDDWLERGANHRESILEMPDLPAPVIAHYYDRFTAVRAEALARLGGRCSNAAEQEEIRRMAHESARIG